MIDRSASPAATVSEPPVVETDWFVPDGGLDAFVLGSIETRYVPDAQFGVVVNCTVKKPLFAIEPPDSRMKPSVTDRRVVGVAPCADCRRHGGRGAEASRNGDVGVLDAATGLT